MAITGKTGADAVYLALMHICHVIVRYRVKLEKVIDSAVAAEVITSAQATTAKDFLATAGTVCGIFQLVAGYSGF
jgi:hypothetical protein